MLADAGARDQKYVAHECDFESVIVTHSAILYLVIEKYEIPHRHSSSCEVWRGNLNAKTSHPFGYTKSMPEYPQGWRSMCDNSNSFFLQVILTFQLVKYTKHDVYVVG